jgi:acetyltransferase-like isoleucine patch superfamily enzyme
MLKKFYCNIGAVIGLLLSYIMPKKLFWAINLFTNSIYSAWLKPSFKKVGDSFLAQYPVDYVGLKFITIGHGFNCFARLRLEAFDKHLDNFYQPSIIIGDNVSINYDCHIACVNRIEIGNNVLIASKVFITDHSHGEINSVAFNIPPSERKVVSKGPIIINNNVWIGEGVCILPNVTIGENSIIGANAVVTKSFPKNSVIGGNPAKLIKTI